MLKYIMDLVILHGWGHSGRLWKNFADKFHNHKVYVFDLPGFGQEKLISQSWNISDYANWVTKKLKAKKIKNAVLIGHSFGGKIATEIALANPKMVSKLILIAAAVLRRPTICIKLKIALYKIFKKTFPLFLKESFFASEYKNAAKSNLGTIFKKSVEYDRTQEIKRLKVPVLIIWGDNDKTSSVKIAVEMHSLINNSQLKIIKNAGHNLQFDNQNILYGFIKNYISTS